MLQLAASRYEQVKISTMSKGELLLALYDGLFRFLKGAEICFEQKQVPRGRELCSKAYAILSELEIALDPAVAPELCVNLAGLYGFCMDRIRRAQMGSEVEPLRDVIRVLTPLKEAWEKAVPEAAQQGICNRAE